MTHTNPSYYAIIPAIIRYDKNLPPGAKLLYGEITASPNKTGECWASNRYFADLYGVDKKTIQRWMGSLQKRGHIKVHIEKDEKKAVEKRIIRWKYTF